MVVLATLFYWSLVLCILKYCIHPQNFVQHAFMQYKLLEIQQYIVFFALYDTSSMYMYNFTIKHEYFHDASVVTLLIDGETDQYRSSPYKNQPATNVAQNIDVNAMVNNIISTSIWLVDSLIRTSFHLLFFRFLFMLSIADIIFKIHCILIIFTKHTFIYIRMSS